MSVKSYTVLWDGAGSHSKGDCFIPTDEEMHLIEGWLGMGAIAESTPAPAVETEVEIQQEIETEPEPLPQKPAFGNSGLQSKPVGKK